MRLLKWNVAGLRHSTILTQITPPPVNLPVSFGALTSAGQGGYPVGGANIVSGNSGGHFTISGGLLTVSAAGASAALNLGPYSLTLDNDDVIDVMVMSNTITVRGSSELNPLITDEARMDGNVVQLRGDQDYGEINSYNAFSRDLLPNGVTIVTDRADPVPIRWMALNGVDVGNVTLEGLKFHRDMVEINHNFVAPQNVSNGNGRPELLHLFNATDVTVRLCEFSSNMTPSALGGLLVDYMSAINGNSPSQVVVEDCNIHHINTGLLLTGDDVTCQNNTIEYIYNDFIRVQNASNVSIIGNTLAHVIGFGKVLHQDFVQLIGDADGVVIEGNVMFPGDMLTNVMSVGSAMGSAGDQVTEVISSDVNLQIDETLHNGRVIRSTVDNLTFTLPASPAVGDSYWFTRSDFTYALNVVASGGLSHAGGLLPRTVDNNANGGTFMVYFDGTQWNTLYGVRAGMLVMPTGTRTLTERFIDRTVVIDASAGAVDLTVPAVSVDLGGISFVRIDRTSNPVTLRAPTGQDFRLNGVNVSTMGVTWNGSKTIRALSNAAAGTWDAVSGLRGEVQGIFGNGSNYTFNDIRMRGNIIWSNSSHGLRLEDDFPDEVFEFNTILRTFVTDNNSDGVVDSDDGWFVNFGNALSASVRMRGDAAGTQARRSMFNLIIGSFDYTDTADDPVYNYGDIGLNWTDPLTFPSSVFNGTSAADYYPVTRDEAIDMALRNPSHLPGLFVGATGSTRANGYWDWDNDQVNALAPDTTAPAVPFGMKPEWVSAATGNTGGAVDITLDYLPFSSTALTDIEVSFETDVWLSLGTTSRGTSTITLAPDTAYTLIGIRGINATGTGEETVLDIDVQSAASTGPTFANSVVPADYADNSWNPRGGTKTITSGWLIQPSTAMRADTSPDATFDAIPLPTAAGTYTVTVDVRANGGNQTVLARPRNVSSGQNPAVTLNTSSGAVSVSTADAAGSIDLGGGVWRLWMKITVGVGDRLLVELPTTAATSSDLSKPAIFDTDLTVQEITDLT